MVQEIFLGGFWQGFFGPIFFGPMVQLGEKFDKFLGKKAPFRFAVFPKTCKTSLSII